ncbi:MAG: (Fe-S)-binding protein, partial [Opitutaceae bacterium]|nr:(Fe-S)-binding protein [Opitutaceae bacterium]
NGVEVHTPPVQPCCGSLHAHNGDLADARALARRLIDLIPPENYDAIITNAGGCGAHLKSYAHLLHDEPVYAARAALWDKKVRDIHEYLAETGYRPPAAPAAPAAPCRHDPEKTCDGDGACESAGHPFPGRTTYHESCHLCHGQKVTKQPRDILRAIPGLELVELPESSWCCGSAGVYNITQPEMSAKLLDRKLDHIVETGATLVTTANPGCHIQLENGLRARGRATPVRHPISLLAEAYRREK